MLVTVYYSRLPIDRYWRSVMVISSAQMLLMLFSIQVLSSPWLPSLADSQPSGDALPPAIYGNIGVLRAKVQGSQIKLTRQWQSIGINDGSGLNETMIANRVTKITLSPDKVQLFFDADAEKPPYTIQTHFIDPSPVFSAMPTGIPEIDQSPALLRLNSTTLESLKQTISSVSNLGDYSRHVEPSSPPSIQSDYDETYWFSHEKTQVTYYPSPTPSPSKKAHEAELEGVRFDHEEGDYLLILPTPSETSSAGYSFTWQPRQVPETSEQASSATNQAENSETSTSNQPSSTSTCDPAPAAKKESSNQALQYQGHRLQAESEYERDLSDKNCTVCLENFREEKKPLTKLSCGHIYHDECLQGVSDCPECRTRIDQSAVTIYPSFDSLEAACQLSCLNELCLWYGNFQLLREHDTCPYPYSYLDENASGSFFSKCRDFIIAWLKEIFEKKKYTVHEIKYYEKLKDYNSKIREASAQEQPCISLVLSHSKLPNQVRLYYSAEDCEKGMKNDIECFQRLIKDIRTDLVFTHLKASYAAMWDRRTGMYIWHWELWNNRLLLSVNEQTIPVALDLFWNPERKDFNFSKLKRAVEGQGLIYADLFKTEPGFPTYSPSYSPGYLQSYRQSYSPESPSLAPISPEEPSSSPEEPSRSRRRYDDRYLQEGNVRPERRRTRSRDRSTESYFYGYSRYGQEMWRGSEATSRPRKRSRSRGERREESFRGQSSQAHSSEEQPSGEAGPELPEESLNLDWLL